MGSIHENSLKNLKPWPKGQSGNPKGRNKVKSFLEIIEEAGSTPDELVEDAIIGLRKEMKKGNILAIKEVLSRLYGAAPQKIDVESTHVNKTGLLVIHGVADKD